MSLWRDELRPTPPTLASLGLLACVAVLSLGRVVDVPQALVYGASALAIGAAFALVFGHRSLGTGFGLLVVLGAGTLPALFVRSSTAALFPTFESFARLRELIASGLSSIPQATPPVPASPQYLVLIWTSMLLLGFLCASWVVVRRPVGAVVSLLAVITFSGSIGEGAGRNALALAAIASTGAVFLFEGRHRIQRWSGRRIRMRPWLGVPTLAGACAVALAAPLVIGDTPVVQLQSAGRPRVVVIKPLADIRRQLEVDPPVEVMRVQSSLPTYWRLTGLDRYDGNEWVLEARPRDLRDGEAGEADPPSTGELLEQRYTLTSLLSPWLPAAYAALAIDVAATVQVDEGSHTLLLKDETPPGLDYTITSRLPRVDANLPGTSSGSTDEVERLFGNRAQPLVAGATTPFDVARRLEEHFRAYTYSEDVPGGHTVARLEQFLEDRAGYCEQFAATMTLMLRGLGIDSRIGVGFLPGPLVDDQHVVTTRDAHAWVEVEIPGAGWVPFDPTPGRADGSTVPPPVAPPPPAPADPEPQFTAVPEPTPVPADPADPRNQSPDTPFPRSLLWTALAVAVVGSVPSAKAGRQIRRRRFPRDAAVTGAWSELLDRAADLGWAPFPNETIREFTSRTLLGDPSATTLTDEVGKAFYAQPESTEFDAAAVWSAQRHARAVIRSRAPIWRRALAPFDPRTLLPKLGR